MEKSEMHVTSGHAFFPVAVAVNGGPAEPFFLCGCGAALSRTLYREEGETSLYELHVFCEECGETHPTYVFARLSARGDLASVTDMFAGKMLPTDLDMRQNPVECPKSKKMFVQPDNAHAFLVRSSWKP
jgi:hypothetical protein